MKTKHPIGRWIRLHDEDIAELLKQYDDAGEGNCSAQWAWLSQRFDFQESCQRASMFQTWRSRCRRVLLWMADKLTGR